MKYFKVLGISCAAVIAGFTLYAEPSLTVYNGNFAVVKEDVELKLKKGDNRVRYDNVTAMAEPDSVILSDPSGKRPFTILEQNYNALTLSQGYLLKLFEGQTIDFLVKMDNLEKIVKGRIIRSGYLPPYDPGYARYGGSYNMRRAAADCFSPIIEIDGALRFSLPGTPLFPPLTDKQQEFLKPSLEWMILSPDEISGTMSLSYISGGMSWEADYNLVMPENGGAMDFIGWVSIDNRCGKNFEDVKIKLMAGDVNKVREDNTPRLYAAAKAWDGAAAERVLEKKFDEYHLYTLKEPVSLKDMETKQVEFINASGVKAWTVYVYDGMSENVFRGALNRRGSPVIAENFGSESNSNVSVMREFENSVQNNLGIPLPKGKLRFYQKDSDGQLEFLGENVIDHTPKDEVVRVYTGNAFDIKGERIKTSYKCDSIRKIADESFEIKLKNHKNKDVEVIVVEHLLRWSSWDLVDNSDPYSKKDSNTIEFKVIVPANGKKTLNYKVHYSW